MQPYIFTLLCLASLASLVAFDAANARKYSAYAQTIENHENFLTVRRAACAEVEYQEKIKKLAPIQKLPKDKETSTPNKVAQVATRKKQRYRLLKVPFSRPPNNSRYNLYALLTESPEEYNNPSSWYAIFVRLLKRAYVDPGIVPQGAEYAITNLLLSKKEEILEGASKYGPDILETLTLPTEEAEVFYTMLKGSPHAQSLLNFLHYEEKSLGGCKLNLIFMDPLLLEAVINHPLGCQELQSLRDGIWDAVKTQEEAIQQHGQAAALELFKTRTDFRLELRDKTQIILNQHGLVELLNKKLFDFTLGSAGDYLFLIDPQTKVVSRCRCSSKSSKL